MSKFRKIKASNLKEIQIANENELRNFISRVVANQTDVGARRTAYYDDVNINEVITAFSKNGVQMNAEAAEFISKIVVDLASKRISMAEGFIEAIKAWKKSQGQKEIDWAIEKLEETSQIVKELQEKDLESGKGSTFNPDSSFSHSQNANNQPRFELGQLLSECNIFEAPEQLQALKKRIFIRDCCNGDEMKYDLAVKQCQQSMKPLDWANRSSTQEFYLSWLVDLEVEHRMLNILTQ